jgi:hypothetical protein
VTEDTIAKDNPETTGASSEVPEGTPKLVAFYLPQFHPIPENDLAWGQGFTEWTNVTTARPLFEGHYQPKLPTDLGFYDLRVPEVMRQQIELARSYHIHGFCFYYYWFAGKHVLHRPLDLFLEHESEFPFCICWANENWSKRWDGSDDEIILEQIFSSEMTTSFIDDVLPILHRPNYIKVSGRPLLLVYRPGLIPDLANTINNWRYRAMQEGISPYVVACQTFGFLDPRKDGFDAAAEFPPNTIPLPNVSPKLNWLSKFEGRIYDYPDAIRTYLMKEEPDYVLFRSAMAGWDNTPRRGHRSHIFYNAAPEHFEAWLSALLYRARLVSDPDRRLVFINAWNEWAEGAHLEPDSRFGRKWLEACARAVQSSYARLSESVEDRVVLDIRGDYNWSNGDARLGLLLQQVEALRDRLKSAETLIGALSTFYSAWLQQGPFSNSLSLLRVDESDVEFESDNRQLGNLEHVGGESGIEDVGRARPIRFRGWMVIEPDLPARPVVTIASMLSKRQYLFFPRLQLERPDIRSVVPASWLDPRCLSGFDESVDCRNLDPGPYLLRIGFMIDRTVRVKESSLWQWRVV